jgi:hypothetical protein
MAYRFICEHCGREVLVRFLKPGEESRCPACSLFNRVPEDAEEIAGPPTTIDPQDAATRSGAAAAAETRWPVFRMLAPLLVLFAVFQLVVGIVTVAVGASRSPGFALLTLAVAAIGGLIYLGLAQGVKLLLEVEETTRRTNDALTERLDRLEGQSPSGS